MADPFQDIVDQIRATKGAPDPIAAALDVLQRAISAPDALRAATEGVEEDETSLFEDEHFSIWRCRFQPHVLMPPHEHRLPVLIAAYDGAESSILYERSEGGLKEIGNVTAKSGEVILLPEDAIHAVTAEGDRPSDAIHVYFGPLMSLKRDLFDWDTGEPVDFTMEAFESMTRPV